MTHAETLACWRSEQIEPAEMVRLCRADPELERLRVEEYERDDAGLHVEVTE